eukprot:CAMPEP_0185596302 /NCGR_PEP_ID=MMETSP0434-20130131/80677_1 /TAXON_ID=626734 ORGANISM="Favella taraikaensis, Strain Fe Narragansett Bay" /NCGR_SAMPLE_ID=MMETSP0434 /ASSEMBLY_ACC=CAM_ASM_000379 /LENGTH=74 /DNA_ID=CAMNT_0028224781 /DNA_START=1275 /DNA_END=1499 /DNA_ORIENTATION=+
MDGHLRLPVLQILFVVGLNRDRVLRGLVDRTTHDSEGTGANLKLDLEFAQLERLLLGILLSATIDHVSEVSELY